MKRLLLTFIFLIVGMYTINAQNNSTSYSLDDLAWCGTVYTDAQIRAVLGVPDEFNHRVNDRGNLLDYIFNKNGDISDHVEYHDEDGLLFGLMTPTFSLYHGRLKVGIHIDDVRTKIGGLMLQDSQRSNVYHFYGPGTTSRTDIYPTLYTNSNGYITHIILINPI